MDSKKFDMDALHRNEITGELEEYLGSEAVRLDSERQLHLNMAKKLSTGDRSPLRKK